MTAPAYQTSRSTTGTGANSASIVVPASTVANNLLCIAVAAQGNVTITTPSGYTKVDEQASGSTSTNVRIAFYQKVAVSSEPNLSVAFSASTQHAVLWIRISGQTATATVVDNYSKNTGTVVTNTFTGFNTSSTDCLLLTFEGIYTSTGTTWTAPTGFTNILQTGTANVGLAVDRKSFAGPGATGNVTNNWASEANGDPWSTMLIAIASGSGLSATTQTFTESAKTVTMTHGYNLSATKQTYTETAVAAPTLYGRKVTATKQTYTETTVAASTYFGFHLDAAQQTYTATGIDVTPSLGKRLGATTTSFSMSLVDSDLDYGRTVTATTTAYTVVYKDAPLRKGGTLAATSTPFSVTGSDATFGGTGASSGRSAAATMALFQRHHDQTQRDMRERLSINDELSIIGEQPKPNVKKKKRSAAKDEIAALEDEIADLDQNLSFYDQLDELPSLPESRLSSINFPQQLGQDQVADDDADDEEVIAHFLQHLF
jgi:hypothetical protein